ncbi:toxin co-regulated pilus biosynthesis Q family protein (plasmid) [Robbsia andropogonis]|uniref:toxin co-regulated pilus biosynthesis Q family protein n=1 Tax=Robbsia andropogonis TaxID=28092 RepID=UPI003D1DCEF8
MNTAHRHFLRVPLKAMVLALLASGAFVRLAYGQEASAIALQVAPYGNPAPVAAPVQVVTPSGPLNLAVAKPALTYVGRRPEGVSVSNAAGAGQSVSTMLHAVVPSDFTVVENGRTDQLVSWRAGQSWDRVIEAALQDTPDVHARIDWRAHQVVVDGPALALPKPLVNSAVATQTASADLSATAMHVSGHFALVAGESLETQLNDWAKAAGWSIAWNTPDDWIVPHGTDFGADFQSAVTRVITAMSQNGADVRADIWRGNRTIVIDKQGTD